MTGSADPSELLIALSRRQKNLPRGHVIEALAKGLKAVNPRNLLQRHVRLEGRHLQVDSRNFDLSKFDRIFVLGGGKASALMASELETILGDRITEGLVIVPDYLTSLPKTRFVHFHKATHPLPSITGTHGMQKMLAMTRNITNRDLVIAVLSGGGSALMPWPMAGLRIDDKIRVTDLLLKSGAMIEEINTVRKHLSATKGGRLAERLYPAAVITLVISDVVSNKLDSIASGPLAPDDTTFVDAKLVLSKYELWSKIPENVRRIIEKGSQGGLPETPKKSSKVFDRVHNFILGSNRDSCAAAARFLQGLGYRTRVLQTALHGEARSAGIAISRRLQESDSSRFGTAPFALVAGGETTVTVRGNGSGGRNQELVLSAALELAGKRGLVVGSIDTDGIDGPTRAAGAVASGNTARLATNKRLRPESFLERNDSYHFFEELNGLIVTGPTGTNVGDLLVAVGAGSASRSIKGLD